MAGFGMVDYSRVDRLRSILQAAAARQMQTQQMQYESDIQRLGLEEKIAQQEEADRLIGAYQRIMGGNGDVETKARMAGPLMAAASMVDPELARFMSEGIGREYQGANLGVARQRVGIEQQRVGIEQQGLGLRARALGMREEGLGLSAQRNRIIAQHYLDEDRRAAATAGRLPSGILNRVYTERQQLQALQAERGIIAGGRDPSTGLALTPQQQKSMLQEKDAGINIRRKDLNDYMGSVKNLYGVDLGYQAPPLVPTAGRAVPRVKMKLSPLGSTGKPLPMDTTRTGIVSGTAPSFNVDEVIQGMQ